MPIPPAPAKHKASLERRITEQQKDDLYNGRITTRELAKILGVTECYLSRKYPGIAPRETRRMQIEQNKRLRQARHAHRLAMVERVKKGEFTMEQAAARCFTTVRTMYRVQSEK